MSNLWVMAVRVSGRRRRRGLPACSRRRATSASSSSDALFERRCCPPRRPWSPPRRSAGAQRLRALGAVAVDGDALKAHPPGLDVGVAHVLDGAFVGHVDGLGDGAADERLGGGHHLQVGQVRDAAFAAKGLKAQSKTGRCSGRRPLATVWPSSRRLRWCRTFDVGDDAVDPGRRSPAGAGASGTVRLTILSMPPPARSLYLREQKEILRHWVNGYVITSNTVQTY